MAAEAPWLVHRERPDFCDLAHRPSKEAFFTFFRGPLHSGGLEHPPTMQHDSVTPALPWALFFAVLAGCGDGGGAGSVPRGPAPSAESLLARAKELGSKGFYTEGGQLLGSNVNSLPPADRGRVLLEEARLYNRANVHALALAAAEAAIAQGITDPDAYYCLAEGRRERRVPGAEEAFTKLLELAPGHLAGHLGLARMRMRSDNPVSSLPLFDGYFKGAAPDDPEYKVALLEHARALRNVGKYQEAADRFALLLEDDPLEGAYYSGLAEALYRMHLRKEGRFVEEIYKLISQNAFEVHVEDRLRETGNTAFALGQRAANRMRQRRYLDAFRSFMGALEADRSDPRIRVFYADLCLRFSRLRDARAVVNRAIQAGMKPASGLWWMLGRIALEAANPHEALAAFQNAVQALDAEGDQGGPERGQAPAISLYLAMGRAALDSADLVTAKRAVTKASALSPQSWEPLFWQGRIELAAGSSQKALGLFSEAWKRRDGQRLMDLSYYSALAFAAEGREEEALKGLQMAQQSSPGFVPAYRELVRFSGADPTKKMLHEKALADVERLAADRKAVEKTIDATPLEGCGEQYLELGKVCFKVKDPIAFDHLFLASDLLPSNGEACELLLSGMKGKQDIFVKVGYLRKLLSIKPGDAGAMRSLAEIYVELHVRLDEAARLADALHASSASAASFRLRGEVALLQGNRAKALELLQAALTVYPQDADLKAALERASAVPQAGSTPLK